MGMLHWFVKGTGARMSKNWWNTWNRLDWKLISDALLCGN